MLAQEPKIKFYPQDPRYNTQSQSRWTHHIQDIVRKTNNNLTKGVYQPPSPYEKGFSLKRPSLEEINYFNPNMLSLKNPSSAMSQTSQAFRIGNSSSGFFNYNPRANATSTSQFTNQPLNLRSIDHNLNEVVEDQNDYGEEIQAHIVEPNAKYAGRSQSHQQKKGGSALVKLF